MATLPRECYFHVGLRRSVIVQVEGSTDLLHMLFCDRYGELSVDLYADLGLTYILGMKFEGFCQYAGFPRNI